MSKDDDVDRLVQYTLEKFDRVDIFINNAARFVFNAATEVTEDGKTLPLAMLPGGPSQANLSVTF